MPKREVDLHAVPIPTAVAAPLDIAGFFQLGDDSLHRSLRDAYELGDVAHPRLWIARETKQHVRVIGEKGPRRLRLARPSRCCRLAAYTS